MKPTPFDDIAPGFTDPGTYEVPTHTAWTLDDIERHITGIVVHDFDGDGRVELVVGGATHGGWEDPGSTSGVYWAEDVTTGGALEDQRPIVWEGIERNVGTSLFRIDDALVVGTTPAAFAPTPQGDLTFVYEDGWRPTFEQASYALAAGAVGVVDWNDDGALDLVGPYGGVAGPIGPGSLVTGSWYPSLQAGRIHDGAGWVALETSGRDLAFVPKPPPPGDLGDFSPWLWTGPRVTGLGRYVSSLDAWMTGRFEADAATAIHPERGILPLTIVSMHDHTLPTTSVVEADFDGDGALEVAMASGQALDERYVFVSVYRGLSGLVSEEDAWVRLHLPPGADAVTSLEATDVDGDGRDELLVAYRLRGAENLDRVVLVTADDLAARVPPDAL